MSQEREPELEKAIESCSTAQAMIEFSANRLVRPHVPALAFALACLLIRLSDASARTPTGQSADGMPDLSRPDTQRN